MNRLNEIEARANAATEGPWEWEGEAKAEWELGANSLVPSRRPDDPVLYGYGYDASGIEVKTPADAEFIAHSRTDVPWLLEQVERRDKALEAAAHVTHPTMAELLKKLEKKGFVTCRTSEKDHRCKVVSATERAHELHHAIGVFDDRVFTALCRGLSEGEIAEFLRITDVMLENAKNMNDAREPFPCGRGCDAE